MSKLWKGVSLIVKNLRSLRKYQPWADSPWADKLATNISAQS